VIVLPYFCERTTIPLTLFEDLRFGARVLAKRPWTTALMVGLLAAGIGVNTTVFTLVNAVLIRGLPYEDAERILYLEGHDAKRNQDRSTSLLDFLDWREQTRTFEELAAYGQGEMNLADDETAPERVTGNEITVNGFDLLRVQPQLGRSFSVDESEPSAELVVVIGHALWQQRYGGSDDVIGKRLRIDEVERTIVGVMPPGFKFPTKSDLWMPLVESDDRERDDRRLSVYGRLAAGVTPGEAAVEMSLVGKRLQEQHPVMNRDVDIVIQTFNENFNGGQIRAIFLAMMGAVGFVLLIACANVANIQLARAMDRAKEISIRTALGATKLRIFRQLLAESLLLAFIGGALGLGLAWVGVYYFDQATASVLD
jgi:putative ABC transport system permease protein